MAKEYGSLTLEQQAKLIGEINGLHDMETDEGAEANAAEIKAFIDQLYAFGFIASDIRCRYLRGLDMAMARRAKKV